MRRREILGLVAAILPALAQTGEELIWRDYLGWYRELPIQVSDWRTAYKEHLYSLGIGRAEVDRRVALIARFSNSRREELRPLFFDRTYASPEPRFNTAPNALLAESIRGVKPGRALDIHMGQGRNAVFLAKQGWEVTGFDYSAEGIRLALESAEKAGVSVDAEVRRHEDFDFGNARWDLVVMCYTWVPLRSGDLGRIMRSLKPGGLLVYEHLMNESGADGAPWLPRPNELWQLFGVLRILRYEDTRERPDWSWRPERVSRLVGRRE
jgi:SAM-dependent methyltransferase